MIRIRFTHNTMWKGVFYAIGTCLEITSEEYTKLSRVAKICDC